MKKFKKALLSILSLALVAVLSIGGTLAYLKSEDSDVNVMTMGNVKIEQLEYERVVDENGNWVSTGETDKYGFVPDKLQKFTQAKPLYPAVFTDGKIKWDDRETSNSKKYQQSWGQIGAPGSQQLFDDSVKNVQDKMVFVKNTGKNDAYVRTWIAFEQGSIDKERLEEVVQMNMDVDGADGTSGHWKLESATFNVEIDGNIYYVMSLRYLGPTSNPNGVLVSNAVSYPSLTQVYMKPEATNEDVEAIDGNKNGTYDILVLSQAVQTAGFEDAKTALDTAFGTSHPWTGKVNIPTGYMVSNSEELATAIEDGETEIWLNEGTYQMPSSAKGKTLTINGTHDSVIKVVPAGQGEANGQLDYSLDGSTVTFNGVTIETNGKLYAGYARLSAVYNDCVIQNTYNLGTGTSEFNNCTFNITNEYLRVGGATKATFNNCTFNTEGRAILVYQDGTSVDQTVTVKDCTFNATAEAYTWNGIHVAAVSFDGSQGGTYTINFVGNNVVGKKFNGLYQDKTNAGNVTVNGLN